MTDSLKCKCLYICKIDLSRAVVGWLDKLHKARHSVILYTDNPSKWNDTLWSRHPFLPHNSDSINQHNRIVVSSDIAISHYFTAAIIEPQFIVDANVCFTVDTVITSQKVYLQQPDFSWKPEKPKSPR